jgi:hypothetical protein
MSIYGVRGTIPGRVGGTPAERPRVEQQPATVRPNAPRPLGSAPAPVAPAGVPATPPPGTDPELWSVLSTDERQYFARLGAMGPLTYGRVLSGAINPATPSVRGGRLDVKA